MTRMSMAEYKKITGQAPAKAKYNNVKTQIDGILFDSKAEAHRYCQLVTMKKSGEIQGFGLQPSFIVGPKIRYIPDFVVCGKDGSIWVEDVKGVETPVFKLKRNLWNAAYPWIELRLIK